MRILGLGDNTVDTYVDLGVQFPGGNAVNVAVFASRLGAQSAYIGCVGEDEAGTLVRSALLAENVDLSRLRQIKGPNARALIGHEGGDRRFISSSPGVRGQYGWEAKDFDFIAGFDGVHTSIYSELDAELPRLAKAARVLSYDHSERWTPDSLQRTLPHLAIAFLSLPDRDDAECEALLARCADISSATVVITRGKAGAIASDADAVYRQPASPAVVVDTLGAGDGFIAAFLLARIEGASMQDALAKGADFAAQVCSWQGAFGRGAEWKPKDAVKSRHGSVLT